MRSQDTSACPTAARLVALALAALAAACSAPTPSPEELAARDATAAAATTAASGDAATPSPALPLSGRLLFAPVEPGGRHAVVALDAVTGARSELFVLAEDHDTLVRDLALSPDGGTLAYTLSAVNAPTRVVLRALRADAEPVVLHEAEEERALNGLQWLPDGSGLVAGSALLSLPEGGRMAVPTAFEIHRYSVPAAGADAGSDEPIVLYREPSEEFTILGAWDEASGRAVLLDGPGEAAYVRAIRVVEAADGQAGVDAEADAAEPLAIWPTAGSGYRFAAGPRAGRPESRWLAIVDEVEGAAGAPDTLPSNAPPSAVRVAEPEGPGLAEIAALPSGMRASDLVWSSDGAWLAWSETPYSVGTGLPQRVRVARLAPNGAPTRVLTATTGAGAIPLAFGPAIGALDAGDAPPLLTGAGVVVLGAMDGDGAGTADDGAAPAAEAVLPPAWDLPPPPENVEPSHALSGLGWPLGWVAAGRDSGIGEQGPTDLGNVEGILPIGAVASPSGSRAAVPGRPPGSPAVRLTIWSLDEEREPQHIDFDDNLRSIVDLAWSPDESRIAVLTSDVGAPYGHSRAYVYDTEDGSIRDLPAPWARDLARVRWMDDDTLELIEDAGDAWTFDPIADTLAFVAPPGALPTEEPTPPPPPRYNAP